MRSSELYIDTIGELDNRIMIDQELSKLGPRERKAVTMELEGYTLREIGAAFGVTREYARQITDKAKRAMRQNISRNDVEL